MKHGAVLYTLFFPYRKGEAGLLTGARIAVAMSVTIETAVLVETLAALGGHVRVCSSNPFNIQDEAAAALAVGTEPSQGEVKLFLVHEKE